MEPHKQVIFDEEAAVDDLATDYFCDKMLIDNGLFEIDKGERKGQKGGKNTPKSGGKKNFQFGDFLLPNLQKVGQLRKRQAVSPQHYQEGYREDAK